MTSFMLTSPSRWWSRWLQWVSSARAATFQKRGTDSTALLFSLGEWRHLWPTSLAKSAYSRLSLQRVLGNHLKQVLSLKRSCHAHVFCVALRFRNAYLTFYSMKLMSLLTNPLTFLCLQSNSVTTNSGGPFKMSLQPRFAHIGAKI